MAKSGWFTGIIFGLIAAVIMLILLPVVVTSANTAQWATVTGAANYLTAKGYIVEGFAGVPANRVPFADAAGDIMTSNAGFTFTPGTTTLTVPNLVVTGTLDAPTGRGATYVVAASDAPAHVKAQADYVCDGTADQTEINAAITAANTAGGGVVSLSVGTFTQSGRIELLSNVHLKGQGVGATIIKLVDASAPAADRQIQWDGNAGSYLVDCSVSDLEVDGNKANQPADGQPRCGIWVEYARFLQIYNVHVHDTYMACGISVGYASGGNFRSFIIRDSWVIACDNNGIDAWTEDYNGTISNVYINGSGWNGINVVGNNNIISECHIIDSGTRTAATYYEIDASATANTIIQNNFIYKGAGTVGIIDRGTTPLIRDNIGYVSENSGTGTLLNANTSVVINHGLATTPTSILITWAENPTNAIGDWWIDTLTTTQFTLNGVDPGASNLDFYWRAVVGAGN